MTQLVVDTLAAGITREIPAAAITQFLSKFEGQAAKDNCGAGCGSGCCGAACLVSPGELGTLDVFGHLGLSALDMNQVGKTDMAALKAAIKAKLAVVNSTL